MDFSEFQQDDSFMDKCIIITTRTKEVVVPYESIPTLDEENSPTTKVKNIDKEISEFYIKSSEQTIDFFYFLGFPCSYSE